MQSIGEAPKQKLIKGHILLKEGRFLHFCLTAAGAGGGGGIETSATPVSI